MFSTFCRTETGAVATDLDLVEQRALEPQTYGGRLLQLRQRSREAALNLGHSAVGGQQLLLENRDVTHLRHLLQN